MLNSKARLSLYYSTIIAQIRTVQERNLYLKNCNDIYTNFILSKIDTLPIAGETYEIHHIIPRALGGPNSIWNVISLSYYDHFKAHELRYLAYNQYVDNLFLRLRTNQTLNKRHLMIAASHLSQKENKSGFYDSLNQSSNGKKGGAKQTQKKMDKYREKLSKPVKQVFSKYMVWLNRANKEDIVRIFLADEIYLVKDLYLELHKCIPFKTSNITTVTSCLARVIKGERKTYVKWSLCVFDTFQDLEKYVESML